MMGRRLLRCRNADCPVAHGALLGRITRDEGIVLAPGVRRFRARLGTGRVVLTCPACGRERGFFGTALFGE